MTLIELVTTTAVLAIVLALAVPSFTSAITRNRLTSQANEVAAAFAVARTEAIRRNRVVTVCGSANGAACGADWNSGWMVWADDNRDGAFDADDDQVIQVGTISPKDTFTADPDPAIAAVAFDRRGRRSAPVGDFRLAGHPDDVVCADETLAYMRLVTVTAAGLISARTPVDSDECP